MMVLKYEYLLKTWGEVYNDDQRWLEKDLGITDRYFWFDSDEERQAFLLKLRECASSHNCILASDKEEGYLVRFRTVAKMTFLLPDGRRFPFSYDFGYGYPPSSAEFSFKENNYSCDCNRSLFLVRNGVVDLEELDCGNSIIMEDFRVVLDDSPDRTNDPEGGE